ncbi:MAG: SsrA-binding protein SmpB [bacterium]
MKTLATNKIAYRDYIIVDKVEAGLVLTGAEVKSIVAGQLSLKESYIRYEKSELFLWNAHVSKYKFSSIENDEYRSRKILLHKNEIERLTFDSKKKGLTIIPLSVYLSNRGKIKIEIALARGKKKFDKREDEVKKDQIREIQKKIKEKGRM